MMKYIVQMRRGTSEQWATSDIIPLAGELVVEIDEINNLHKLKIGDGVHVYSELAYLQAGDEIVTQILSETKPHVVTITLDVDKWVENSSNANCYYQTVAIDNVTKYSRLDLQPDSSMLAELNTLGISFVTENIDCVITVHSVGNKPTTTYVMQATVVETDADDDAGAIVGAPVTALRKVDAVIDDESETSATTTWSTSRIKTELTGYVDGFNQGISNVGSLAGQSMGVANNALNVANSAQTKVNGIIDDSDTHTDKTWSSEQINTAINNVNTAFQNAIGGATSSFASAVEQRIPLSQKGVANGVAELDSNATVPIAQLPMTEIINKVLEALNA